MAEVHLSAGEQVTVKCCCDPKEPSTVNLYSSEGVDPSVVLFEVTDGMPCPQIGIKKSHEDDYPKTSMNAAYMGETDDGFPCIILSDEFPDRKVKVRPDHSTGTPAEMPQEFTILNFRGDTLTIYLDQVLGAFTAAQLKAAMTPTMRSQLAAILP